MRQDDPWAWLDGPQKEPSRAPTTASDPWAWLGGGPEPPSQPETALRAPAPHLNDPHTPDSIPARRFIGSEVFSRNAPKFTQALYGVTESAMRLGEGLSRNAGNVLPGRDPFQRFADWTRQKRQEFEGRTEPQTTGEALARIGGNIVGEGAQYVAGGAGVRKLAGPAVMGVAERFAPRLAPKLAGKGMMAEVAKDAAAMAPVDLMVTGVGPENSTLGAISQLTDERFPRTSRLTGALAENPVTRFLGEVAIGGSADAALRMLGRGVKAGGRKLAGPSVSEGLNAAPLTEPAPLRRPEPVRTDVDRLRGRTGLRETFTEAAPLPATERTMQPGTVDLSGLDREADRLRLARELESADLAPEPTYREPFEPPAEPPPPDLGAPRVTSGPYSDLPDDELIERWRKFHRGKGRTDTDATASLLNDMQRGETSYGEMSAGLRGDRKGDWGRKARGRDTQADRRIADIEREIEARGLSPSVDPYADLKPSDVLEPNKALVRNLRSMSDAELESEIAASLSRYMDNRELPDVAERMAILYAESQKPTRSIAPDAFGAAHPALVRALGTAGGAGIGAGLDEENRLRGAVLGAAAVNAPALARHARSLGEGGFAALPGKWYSRLERAVEKGPGKATGEQWLGFLNPAKRGFAEGEAEWSGIRAWLGENADAKLTKDEVLGRVRERGVRLEERISGLTPIPDRVKQEADAALERSGNRIDLGRLDNEGNAYIQSLPEDVQADAVALYRDMRMVRGNQQAGRPRFAEYTQPGGENYREVLVKLDTSPTGGDIEGYTARRPEWSDDPQKWEIVGPDGAGVGSGRGATPNEAIAAWARTSADVRGPGFTSSHWPDDPNVLTHLRLKDRTINGDKTLFVEEIQSDWHQKGREQGYATPASEKDVRTAEAEVTRLRDAHNADVNARMEQRRRFIEQNGGMQEILNRVGRGDAKAVAIRQRAADMAEQVRIDTRESAAALQNAQDRLDALRGRGKVPDAPYKSTDEWVGLSVRRALQEAVEGGYDRIAWVSGEQAANLYDLQKQVGAIEWNPETRVLAAYDHGGSPVLTQQGVTPENMADYIGKEPAKRLLASEATPASGLREQFGPRHRIEGEDLKVGGEGMLEFYDRIVPKVFQKEAKALGLKVDIEPVDAMFDVPVDARAKVIPGEPTNLSIRITPEAREAVRSQGTRLYARGAPALAGASVGYASGDTPEERRKRALAGGAIGLGIEMGPSALRGARSGELKKLAGRELRVRGDLPEPVFDAKRVKDSWVSAEETTMRYVGRDFRQAARQAYGKSYAKLPETEVTKINNVLAGSMPPESLPEAMRGPVQAMRDHVDAMSRELIESGAVEGKLAAKVEGSMGTYLNRSYQVFDDPKWAKKVPEDVRNRAKGLLRSEYPDASDAEIEGLIDELLYRHAAKDEGPIAAYASGKLGSKNLGILKRRKDIPPEIRALWGEYKDPLVNYAKSVAKMANIISNHRFLTTVREGGMGGFLHESPVVLDGVSYSHRIAADGSKTMAPLNGLYTSKEIADAFDEALDPATLGPWMRHYMKVNTGVKVGKTVGSVVTQVRNLLSNPMIELANGNWRLLNAGKAAAAVGTQVSGPTESVVRIASKIAGSDTDWRKYYTDLQRLGVVDESANQGELRDLLRDAGMREGRIEDAFADPASGLFRKGAQVAGDVYRANDDLFKVYAFEGEMARYRKALPDVPEDELAKRVAKIVTDTRPTYSKVPKLTRRLRRVPFVGNFVSFPSEMIRTAHNTLKLAASELADPALRGIGAQRLGGMMAAITVVGGAAAYSRHLMGVTRDTDEDLRTFMPPWSENANILHLGKDADGNWKYIDLSYTDPYSYLRKPVVAVMRGDDPMESLKDAAVEFFSPFLSEEILASTLMNVRSNQRTRGTGNRIYNPEDPEDKQLQDIIAYVVDKVEPGTIESLQRIKSGLTGEMSRTGRTYDPSMEIKAMLTGQRVGLINPTQGLFFRAQDLKRRIQDVNRGFTFTLTRLGTVEDKEIGESYETTQANRQELFKEASEVARAARRLGVTNEAIVGALRQAGFTIAEVEAIAQGGTPMYEPSDQLAKNFRERMLSAGMEPSAADSTLRARGAATGQTIKKLKGTVR